MQTFSVGFRLALVAAVLSPLLLLGQTPTPPARSAVLPGPIPPAILAARRIFVSNAGADSDLFPHPFSGEPSRGYDELYAALRASGDYELVTDPGQADVVLELRLQAPYGPTNPNKHNGTADPLPMFRLVIYDRPTHYILWTLTESVDTAFKQQVHDRNFDEAIVNLVSAFQALRHSPAGK
jgi:hypothetical protein